MNRVKIGEIGKIVTGKTPKTVDSKNYGNKYLFISPTELHKGFIIKDSEKKISQKGFDSIKSNTISGLSVLVGCIGWDMGNVALVDETCATNQQINAITNIKDRYNPFYLYYWLKGKKEYLFQIANVTRTPILNKTDFSNIEIDIPNKIIQDKISEILVSLDRKIDNNIQINNNLEELMKTLYQRWFIEFNFPNEDGKPYKASGGKMIYNDELKRDIPEGWYVRHTRDLLNVITGKEDANFSSPNGIYPFFTCSSEILRCDEAKYNGKAVLIAGNGDFNVKYYEGAFNAYQRTYVLIPNESKYVGLLYRCALERINSFKKGSNGSIVKFITKGDIENITVLVPKNDELLLQLNTILDKVQKGNEEIERLASLRDFLLPMLMNGQINVDDIKI